MSGADQFAVKMKTGQNLTSDEDRAKRLSNRSFKGWHARNLARILPLYAKQVTAELGADGKTGVCPMCERPHVTDRAFRAVEKALDRELGSGAQVSVQLLAVFQQLGCRDESEARALIALARSAEGADKASVIEMSRKLLVDEGWTCLPPQNNATEGENGHHAT